ncbi:MAG: hypothetical protein JNL06_15465 [Alphaproteobacteria bacterium]|nr:hypothetical protein [Alphaproteobacteria bacterium]
MTGFRWLASLAFGVTVLGAPSVASAFDAQAAKKTCLENYNAEKDAGTIPAGMPKSKYVSQCTNSMRRNAELEKQLADSQVQSTPAVTGGSNEITATVSTKPSSATSTTGRKPATVTTPAFAQPRGY